MTDSLVVNDADASLPFHRHDDARVIVVLEGEICESSISGRHTYGQGDFLFRPPFCAHENAPSGKPSTFLRLPVSRHIWLAAVKRHGWRALCGKFEFHDRAHRDMLRPNASGDAFLNFSLRLPDTAKQRPDVVRSKSFAALASETGVRPYALTRKVKREFGLTPTEFRREWRLRAALDRLASGSMAIADIASECGFADQSHLTRTVRTATGYSPAAFRRFVQA